MVRRFVAFGAALMMAGALWLLLYSVTMAQIERGGPVSTPTPDAGPPATPMPGATPTVDRLAPPPTVANPNQADEGAYLFWLHCMPCHGDRGQGLTDEFRVQYPHEDQNCWNSGCHGERPYGQGFQLPTAVPAIIGDGTLQKFETMDAVYRYASVAMPYFYPGSLTQEEYLAILAHIAREDGLWDGTELTVDNLTDLRLRPEAAVSSPTAATDAPRTGGIDAATPVIFGIILVALIGGAYLWRNRGR